MRDFHFVNGNPDFFACGALWSNVQAENMVTALNWHFKLLALEGKPSDRPPKTNGTHQDQWVSAKKCTKTSQEIA